MGNSISERHIVTHIITGRMLVVLLGLMVTLLPACTTFRLRAEPAQIVGGGDAQRGARAIQEYGCGACHNIPGIAGANALVGPPLDGWAKRHYISGRLPNEPQFLIEWIRFPQEVEPGTAMPNMGVTEEDARDISAYLYSLTDKRN
jgi:cytochrome c2